MRCHEPGLREVAEVTFPPRHIEATLLVFVLIDALYEEQPYANVNTTGPQIV